MSEERRLTKADLLDRIRRSRAAFVKTIDALSDAQMEAREEGGWAVKDHLIHLATWEHGVAEFLRGRSRTARMGLDEQAGEVSLDEVNEVIYEQTAALSAAEARQMLEEAHVAMLDALDGLSEADLAQPHVHFLPHGEEEVATERLVLETIVANTYEHYDEHAEMIRQMFTAERRLTKAELLDQIQRSRAALEKTIDSLSDAQLEAREEGGWAVKDHLAHIAAWELGIARLLRGRPRFEAMGVDELVRQRWELDEINERIYRQAADLTPSQALQTFNEAHEEMLAALDGLDDEDLLRPYAGYAAQGEPQPPTAGQDPVVGWIIGNTFVHYDEHAETIRAMLGTHE